jgi:hypothetical protein
MSVADFNCPNAEGIALLVQFRPINARDFHYHPINIWTIDAPQFWVRQFQRYRRICFAWPQRKRLALVRCWLVVRTESGCEDGELSRFFQMIAQEDAVLNNGPVLLDPAAYLLPANLDPTVSHTSRTIPP